MTKVAGESHVGWTPEETTMLVGLVAAIAVVLVLTRVANKAIEEFEAGSSR